MTQQVKQQATETRFLIGADENGLGSRLGPMIVTAVMAEVSPPGERWLKRKLPKTLAGDLGDSKALVRFGRHALAEAWCRALVPKATTPAELLAAFSLRTTRKLQSNCPPQAKAQCWPKKANDVSFEAPPELVARIAGHLKTLARRGVSVCCTRSEILCAAQLNQERDSGGNRFISDLHAMERLIIALRKKANGDVLASCGKVGGIGKYPSFFGPLSDKLRTTLKEERGHSAYHFVGLGEVHFIQALDSTHPLVMLASLVGKYLRELTMGRVSDYYASEIESISRVSGYHDPVTARLVQLSASRREASKIPVRCFER